MYGTPPGSVLLKSLYWSPSHVTALRFLENFDLLLLIGLADLQSVIRFLPLYPADRLSGKH